ncbi:MAG: enoyl-CoA hydratase/isomerase family protein [Actinomycetales bacterium]
MNDAAWVSAVAAAEEAGVAVEPAGSRLDVVLNRPDVHNAQTPGTWRAFAQVLHALPRQVRVVVVRGHGPSFSSGLDRRMFGPGIPGEASLGDLASLPPERLSETIAAFQEGFTCWRPAGVLTVAAVHGAAIGAGFQLALACDLILTAEDARFVMAEPTLGLVPDLGGTLPLVQRVGRARATEICLTGRAVSGGEASAIGLAEVSVPATDLLATVDDLVAAVLALPAPSAAATLELLRGAALAPTLADQLAAERSAQGELLRQLAASRNASGVRAVDRS